MIPKFRLSKSTLLFGGLTAWGALLISCMAVNRTTVAPPQIAGATFIGSKECAVCHKDKAINFATASHSRLAFADASVGATGCEACHGPGSLHQQSSGARGTIVNPRRSPEACFKCHLDKRGQFSLPNSHPVLAGKVSCADCHDVHEGNAIRGTGAALARLNDTCTRCHIAQKGPFAFEHAAIKEGGCTACHNPHGTVNQRMLIARDQNLCLRCHLESPVPGAANIGQLNANTILQTGHAHNSDFQRGTCWSAACHEAMHGSNADNLFRR
jgi:predicted CXXCH cytochrome family protein